MAFAVEGLWPTLINGTGNDDSLLSLHPANVYSHFLSVFDAAGAVMSSGSQHSKQITNKNKIESWVMICVIQEKSRVKGK